MHISQYADPEKSTYPCSGQLSHFSQRWILAIYLLFRIFSHGVVGPHRHQTAQ